MSYQQLLVLSSCAVVDVIGELGIRFGPNPDKHWSWVFVNVDDPAGQRRYSSILVGILDCSSHRVHDSIVTASLVHMYIALLFPSESNLGWSFDTGVSFFDNIPVPYLGYYAHKDPRHA